MNPERRQAPRHPTIDGTAVIDGHSYPLLNWSRTGCQVGAFTRAATIDQQLAVRLEVPADHGPLRLSVTARVVRLDHAGLALHFYYLSPEATETLDRFFAGAPRLNQRT